MNWYIINKDYKFQYPDTFTNIKSSLGMKDSNELKLSDNVKIKFETKDDKLVLTKIKVVTVKNYEHVKDDLYKVVFNTRKVKKKLAVLPIEVEE